MKRSVKRAGGQRKKDMNSSRGEKKKDSKSYAFTFGGRPSRNFRMSQLCGVKRRKSKEKKKRRSHLKLKKNQGRCVRTSRDIFQNGVSQK